MITRIRTITATMQLRLADMDHAFERASRALHEARDRFVEEGIEVQTLRASTQPFQSYMVHGAEDDLLGQVISVDRAARSAGIDLVSVGFASAPRYIDMAPSILRSTERTSLSAVISDRLGGVLEENIASSAKAISEISGLSEDGIGNFNFACIANCPPGIPFFPASHHYGGRDSLSIGLESGDIAVSSIEKGGDRSAEDRLAEDYWKECLRVQGIALGLETPFQFLGIDTSWNPSLSEGGSVARAISGLSGVPFGSPGTLTACATMARTARAAHVKRCGYSGLMLPVLEDLELTRAADEGRITVQTLLSYSAVCGTGLDAVPVPGDATGTEISNVLKDVANLSYRLDKPLSARLLPVPGAGPGERSRFDSPYIANCMVLPLS